MSESSQHSQIAKLIQDIISACREDPSRIEVAIANFEALITSITRYALAPAYYNTALEGARIQHVQPGQPNMLPQDRQGKDPYKFPVVGQLEKIFGQKLKQKQLQEIGKILAEKIGLKLDRDTKRSKPQLLKWFSVNWETLHPRIYDFKLNNMWANQK